MSENAKQTEKKVKGRAVDYTRRHFLKAGATMAASVTLSACLENTAEMPIGQDNPSGDLAAQPDGKLNPTPPCGDETVSNPAGPFYTKNAPERNRLVEPGMKGTPLLVTGQVLTTDCQPLAGATLDFWHTDTDGNYDNAGFRLRGKQQTDESGNYRLETIMPGLYPGRTRHIHVKVIAPNGTTLTTQIYFEGEPANRADALIHPSLLMPVADDGDGGKTATFDFVLAV